MALYGLSRSTFVADGPEQVRYILFEVKAFRPQFAQGFFKAVACSEGVSDGF